MRYGIAFVVLGVLLFGCVCCSLSPGSDGGYSNSCDSNSDCEHDERCRQGVCVEVECTTDSDCGSCERCSGYNCVDCGSGPYGCYC